VSSTQTDPPRPAPRKARATSPLPAPGGKTFGGTRASRARGTPPTRLPAIHVVKFASFAEAHQFHHSPVPPGPDSGPFRPTGEFDPISRAGSSAPWALLPALPNTQWASMREGGAHGKRQSGATSPHVEIVLEEVPELREGGGEAGETRTSSRGRLLWLTARSAFAAHSPPCVSAGSRLDRARAARHRSPHRNESTAIATSDRPSHQRQRQPSLHESAVIPSAPLREIAGQKRVATHSTRGFSSRSHPPFNLSARQPQACTKARSACHGQLKSVRGADRLISGSHRPGRL